MMKRFIIKSRKIKEYDVDELVLLNDIIASKNSNNIVEPGKPGNVASVKNNSFPGLTIGDFINNK